MEFSFMADGSFDLLFDGIALKNAYPEIDGIPVRPLGVRAAADGARYELAGGALEIHIGTESGLTVVRCKVEGLADAHDIFPIGSAKIEGCDRVFRQGLGLGGPSGFSRLDGEPVASHSLVALGGASGCIAVYARRQDRLHNLYEVRNRQLRAGFETERVPLGAPELPLLYIKRGDSFSDTLHDCAGEIAAEMHARPVTRPAFHWCSWYYLYHTLDQKTLEEYLAGFTKHRDIAPFTHIQIDAGYFPSTGDWLETTDRFPGGLKKAAETIRAAGYEPGIWIAPFMVGSESKLFREHPDWVLKDREGKYVVDWACYNEPKPWGYRDSEYYVLDTSCPDAMEYLRGVFRTLREWGYTLFKTDFLFYGLKDSSRVTRNTPGKTSFEYFRDVMRMIRETIGEDARWLGCISPFMPALGFVDMMRIAGDVGAYWKEGDFGPMNMIRELTADRYFNLVYWQNDSDSVMLRDFHICMDTPQIEALAVFAAMSGAAIYTSDPIHLISEDRRKLLGFIRPDALHSPEYPYWSEMRDETVIVQRLKTRTLVFFFNPTDRPVTSVCDWKALAGDGARWLYRYHGGKSAVGDVPFIVIPPREGVLFFASAVPIDKEPENMWEESFQ